MENKAQDRRTMVVGEQRGYSPRPLDGRTVFTNESPAEAVKRLELERNRATPQPVRG